MVVPRGYPLRLSAQRRFTVEDYWGVEASSPVRHEYLYGAIYAMAGGSPRHNEVASNIQAALWNALRDTDCRPVGADQRIRVSDAEYTYADVTVYCGRIQTAPGNPPDTATNPVVVVEVLSAATRDYDRGDKCEMYRGVASVREILLVEPKACHVTQWSRSGETWSVCDHTDSGEVLTVLKRSISMVDIYARTLT